MRNVRPHRLIQLVAAIMQAGGCQADEAQTIARRLVDSNLVGHDSHGVIRVGKYLEWMRAGWVKANQAPSIVFESDTIAIIDGNRGFGQVVGEFAGKIGTAKAAKSGIAMVGLRNCGHLGRVGEWAELAAEAGQVSLHFLNTSGAQRVAPFGGSDRRLSTNPITIGVPLVGAEPIILDVTTSMVAEGKLFVASNKGEQVPAGWIIDKNCQPTTDPKAFYDGGALLTVGAHKGSGLSIVVDLLAGAISTGKSSDPEDTVLRNNMLSIYIAPDVYDSDGAVAREAARFIEWVKASPPAMPGQAVLMPGEIERMTRARRSVDGVALDDKTLADLVVAAESTGIAAAAATKMLGA
ncbi:MAG: malate/lactate/ureidoglycolate dehydrogenase [Casimicrobiaceae bacterium]